MRRRRIFFLAILCPALLHCASSTPPPEKREEVARLDPIEPPRPIEASAIASETVEPPPPEVVEPPPPPPPPPPRHYRALIIGDSMAATDFGDALEKQLEAHDRISCARWGKSSTGLARPDFFDWMRQAERLVKKHAPDLVVVIIGGNDGQDLIGPKGKKAGRIFWRGSEWREAYRSRIERFLDLLTKDGRRVLWIELPLMDQKNLEEKLRLIRSVQKAAVDAVDGATWISTRNYFVDRRGRLVRTQKIEGWKRPQQLRQQDGIHFTVAGAQFFATRVYPDILAALGL